MFLSPFKNQQGLLFDGSCSTFYGNTFHSKFVFSSHPPLFRKQLNVFKNFIRTKRSEQAKRAKRAHSVLREVEKMGYKNFSPVPV